MPLQCGLNFKEFQEEKLRDHRSRSEIASSVRPKRCPYCGQHEVMRIHSWCPRYVIDEGNASWRLLIPVFVCTECHVHIRVLPLECHAHCNHLSQTIRSIVLSWIRNGRHVRSLRIGQRLQRHWVRRFLLRLQSSCCSLGTDPEDALSRLPSFSFLFHRWYRTLMQDRIEYCIPSNQRIFSFDVCLGPG